MRGAITAQVAASYGDDLAALRKPGKLTLQIAHDQITLAQRKPGLRVCLEPQDPAELLAERAS